MNFVESEKGRSIEFSKMHPLRAWHNTALTCLTLLHEILSFAAAQSKWPPGTQALASTVLAPISNPDCYFNESLAIDGATTTFWNDATQHLFPDTLTLTFPKWLTLNGITLLSHPYGWVTDYQVQVLLPNNSWEQVAHTRDIPYVFSVAKFAQPVECLAIQITINNGSQADNNTNSRINEVAPVYVDGKGSDFNDTNTQSNISPTSNSTAGYSPQVTSASSSSSDSKAQSSIPNRRNPVAAIIGGTIGGVLAFLLALTAAFRVRRRKLRGQPQIWERKRPQKKPASMRICENVLEGLKAELDSTRHLGVELDAGSVIKDNPESIR